jgi:NADPH:quinone reductase-like Zn-dependent oxidoreductase
MKAVLLHGYGGVEQLVYEDAPEPKPQAGEVLVKVVATSVNPIDWKIRRGDMKDARPVKFPVILGRDVAGIVAALGPNTQGFQPGDRVMGLVDQAYAEFLVTKRETLARIPDGLETEDAGALPLVVTMGAQLIEQGIQPKAGQTVLITGTLGNVGRTAVYVAKKHGMTVIAGVRAKERKEAEALQADRVVAIDEEQGIASLGQVDAIADTVGGSVITKLMPYIRPSGVLASVLGKPDGAEGQPFQVRAVFAQPDAQRLQQLAEAVANGEFSIPIAKRMKLSQVREAQTMAEAGGVSKILLLP